MKSDSISASCGLQHSEQFRFCLGGTAVGTGINAASGFGDAAAAEITKLTSLAFVSAEQIHRAGCSRSQVQLFGALRTLALSLYEIANDMRLMSVWSTCRFRRASDSRKRAGLLDHAGQSEPDPSRCLRCID
jgi:fumarate hydratase class II